MSRPALWVLAWDQVRNALPILAVAGLAGYTWWLVQAVPGTGGAGRQQVAPSVPDYVLQQAVVERFDAAGRRLSVLSGESMTHYLEGDLLVVRELHLVAQDEQGQRLQALGRQGQFRGERSLLELSGQARVTAQASQGEAAGQGPITFEGEVLRVNTATRVVSSDRPVRVSSAGGTVTGQGFTHDARRGTTQVQGRVSGRLDGRPRAPAGGAPASSRVQTPAASPGTAPPRISPLTAPGQRRGA